MSVMTSPKRLVSQNWPSARAIRESEAIDEALFDDEHFELIDGILVEKTMGAEEQFIDSDLLAWLAPYVRDHGLGWTVMECKFALPNVGNNRIPDLAYLSYETWPKAKRRPKGGLVAVAPDLVVEVISPTDGGCDVMTKLQEYFTAGCKAVWIVWPRIEQVHAYSSPTSVRIFARTDVLVGDPVVPGFSLDLTLLFPSGPPEEDPAP